MANLVYIDKIAAANRMAFQNKVITISAALKIDPNWLMQVMKSESGINPQAKNIQNGRVVAVGLIQFMSPTAALLGTSLDALLAMDHLQQLDYVYKYFKGYTGKLKSYYDVYLVTFFPAAVGKPDDWVFATSKLSAAIIAKQNPVIDRNKNGSITIAEFKEYVQSTIPASLREVIFKAATGGAAILFTALVVFF